MDGTLDNGGPGAGLVFWTAVPEVRRGNPEYWIFKTGLVVDQQRSFSLQVLDS
jgi:hypothetical protein